MPAVLPAMRFLRTRQALLLVEELVDQGLSIMPDDLPADTAVVVLVFDAAAAADEIGRLRYHHLDVVVAIARAVHNLSARCFLRLESPGRRHVCPPVLVDVDSPCKHHGKSSRVGCGAISRRVYS